MPSILRNKDLLVGAIFVAIGLFFALGAAQYPLGTASRMGPGYMPLLLGSALVLLGIVVAVAGRNSEADTQEAEARPIPWKAMALVGGAVVLFGLGIRGLGFVPVVFIAAFAASQASRLNSVVFSLLLAATLTAICTAIFIFGLGITVPMVGAWLK
jgi:hypothetical protein